jgi:RND family efflux transporter MFP subunit
MLYRRGALSRSDLDRSLSARDTDAATREADKALVSSYMLNLDYTQVKAPISGRVSRYLVTVGNLVQSGDQGGGTLLTTVVSVDPMYAYFDVDEGTIQRARRSIRQETTTLAGERPWPVSLGLATEEGFPHRGTIKFVDNQVNAKTGTMRVRGRIPEQGRGALAGLLRPRPGAHEPAPPGCARQRPRPR